MNTDEIKQEVLSQLGYPTVDVEIDEATWPLIFQRAKRWFHTKKGVPAVAFMAAQKEMDPPADCEVVYDVILPSDGSNSLGAILTAGFFRDIVPADVITQGNMFSTGFSNFSAFTQLLQQIDMVRRTFSSEPDWNIGPTGKIQIMPGELTGTVMVVYKQKRDAWDVESLVDRDEDIFYRAVLNEAKYVLSRVRGKYPNYPAAGGNIETDAKDLYEEWKDGREELNQEIADMAMPIGWIRG